MASQSSAVRIGAAIARAAQVPPRFARRRPHADGASSRIRRLRRFG